MVTLIFSAMGFFFMGEGFGTGYKIMICILFTSTAPVYTRYQLAYVMSIMYNLFILDYFLPSICGGHICFSHSLSKESKLGSE